MNFLWGGMIVIGILYGAVNGTMQEVADAALVSSKEAVTLCITMAGVMSLWVGLMKIAEESGMVAGLTRALFPFIRFMFPQIPKEHPANQHISMNIIANVLGLGWAATPAGLKAMESLAELEEERRRDVAGKTEADIIHNGWEKKSADMAQSSVVQSGVAQGSAAHKKNGRHRWERGGMPPGVVSNEMCTFLILNISSLQLIPVNIIAYRSQYGSVSPTIVGPGILATAVSTGVAGNKLQYYRVQIDSERI